MKVGKLQPRISINTPWALADYPAGLTARRNAGLTTVLVSDHISFRDGSGQDGLIRAAMAHALAPELTVLVGVYLLALRHPLLVARQLAELNSMAPGRLLLGVGVGGEDRHEIESCGVDPRSRGARTDEALECLRQLQSGQPVNFAGQHFQLDAAQIIPPVDPPVPILIGGRSDQALSRTARHGDGWLGIWCSVERFSQAIDAISTEATEIGRQPERWQHGMQVWCAIDDDAAKAKARLARRMEDFYKIPFARFERYCPAGTAEHVAAFVADYVRAGAGLISLIPVGPDPDAIAGVAAVQAHLQAEFA